MIIPVLSPKLDKESMHIDKSADWYNLIGLHPGTHYTIKFVTEYAVDRSDSVYISSFDSRDIRYISSSIRVHSLKYP
jgi:hypothetical protein